MKNIVRGISASKGIVMGKAYLFEKVKFEISQETVSNELKEEEKGKIRTAIFDYVNDLKNRDFSNDSEKSVAEAHIELIQDPYLVDTVDSKIDSLNYNVEKSLSETISEMVMMMESLDDEYLKERASDYKDVGEQLMYKLKNIIPKTLEKLEDEVIVISEELTPSDTSTMDKKKVLGFVMNLGGKTSHVSIIAQTLSIPAIVGTKNATDCIKHGDFLILDANEGQVIVNPDEKIIEEFNVKIKELENEKKRLDNIKFEKAVTKDGRKVEIACNIGNIEDLELGLKDGAEGVGLFRTEFLYMEAENFPSEEIQFQAYRTVAEKLEGKPLIIRTLDIGGDKGLSYFDFPTEENPFLGWRALRIAFDEIDILKAQLRAILRASAFGNVKILLPMIISVEEIAKVQEYIKKFKQELDEENIKYDPNIEVGIMIETPASVLVARDLIEECDFFSIGTNDLTQYILAVDRGNDVVSHLYNHFNPAVLKAIKTVIDASHDAGKWTGMCGSMASDTMATYLLLGMGLDEFSSVGSQIGKIKDIVRSSDFENAKHFAEEVLKLRTLEEIESKLEEANHG
ncbi:MAG: phosphoenolpyruvate--protein phosphotransferase [Tissierellia bacterium]|nr:phosphoenolpyruvate--protein phosphotransferase [Tissierellia bacterium]